MSLRPRVRLAAIGYLLLLTAVSSSGAAPPPLAPSRFAEYLAGLDALSEGKFNDADAAFTRALETRGDDPTFVLARGVALTLAEQSPKYEARRRP